MMLYPGLYEQVINREIKDELKTLSDALKSTARIDETEASKVLSQYLLNIVKRGLDNVIDNDGDVTKQVELVNEIVRVVERSVNDEMFSALAVDEAAEQLLALLKTNDPLLSAGKAAKYLTRPETSIAQSSLFTGAVHEPQMYTELKKEIASADRIDMLVSFIKWSGLRLIIDDLAAFSRDGGKLRVITTAYMGATDVKAVEELQKLIGSKIRISYDTKRTRLHAKTYVFYRNTGFTTAYVGSSNLSNAAISSGLEWNVKVTKMDQPETIDKIAATFEIYWNSNEFELFEEGQKERLIHALKAEKYSDANNVYGYTLDISPYSYQQEILDRLKAERIIHGCFRNLIVAATGTGKTVISALDYKRFQIENPGQKCRLLFVAHREEILKQSLYTFRAVLKDANFGEMFVGNYRPDSIENLFISIQTFNSQDYTARLEADFYDYIVVDEFHHAAAPSYKKLLDYFHPKILLGLTATPERMDGRNILEYFNGRISAEIRLPEAIERKLLCPFQYFGVTDTIDLNELKWSRGGYDKSDLSHVYTLNGAVSERRVDLVVASLLKYVTDMNDVKGLGFCVSIEHAEFMSDKFNERRISSIFLTGSSADEERKTAKQRLISGEIRFIFVVDIYNEGIDIPEVNTVLFLRPTESLTIFLQQLGRGLRLSENKECLTVLDFIGGANKRYNFEAKFSSLLANTSRGADREIRDGFPSAPKGCYIQLERIAEKNVLENIRSSYGNTAALISRIESFEEDSGLSLTLENFLEYYRISLGALYKFSSFSRLCVRAGKISDFSEPAEEVISKSLIKIAAIDSRRFISFLLNVLPRLYGLDIDMLTLLDQRMMQMFYTTVWGKTADNWESEEVISRINDLAQSSVMISEIIELLKYNSNRIDFIDESVDLGFECPLDLHCTYTRDQLLVAMGFMNPTTVREGVKWLPDLRVDAFFITLYKSDKDYSPTTMYNDYSITETLFHWQSQSTTSENSATGLRYINHHEQGSRVLLFVREYKTDRVSGNAMPYTFLGTANYVTHEGSKPMNIVWQLDRPIPAKFLKKTNKLLVG